jgi:DNA-binding PadR family transcriptional regulator
MGSVERVMLQALADSGSEMFGLDIIAACKGVVGRGTVYVRLARLQDAGLVSSRLEREKVPGETEIPRRLYAITDAGLQTLKVGP